MDTQVNLQETVAINHPRDGSAVATHPDKDNVEVSTISMSHPSIMGSPDKILLANYLSRDFIIYHDLVGAYPSFIQIDLINAFFTLPDIEEKLKYFKLIRGNFRIRAVLTVNPYVTGRVALAPHFGNILPATDLELTFRMQNGEFHVLDASRINQVLFDIPMLMKQPYLDVSIPIPTFSIPRLCFAPITLFQSTQDGEYHQPMLKIYASFVNADIAVSIPRGTNGIYTSEQTETLMDGQISYPASIIARFAASFKDAPIIGKFAYATSLAAGAVSKIAILFGLSRPRNMSTITYPHAEDYNAYVSEIRSKVLALDPQQEIPLDNEHLNVISDPLIFNNNIRRYGIVGTVAWPADLGAYGIVGTFPVSPMVSLYDTTNQRYTPTNMAYFSQLYNLWRGSIIFKLVVVANHYVRGKLRIWYQPANVSVSTSGTWIRDSVPQNAYSVVMDISAQTEVELEVPFMSSKPWLSTSQIISYQNVDANFLGTCCNGVIYITVEDALIAPSEVYDCPLLMYCKAGKSFEFAQPTTELINNISVNPPSVINPATVSTFADTIQISPPASALIGAYNTNQSTWGIFTAATVEHIDVTFAPNFENTNASILTIGESFDSLRPLLKRFYPLVNIPVKNATRVCRQVFPVFPGVYGNSQGLLTDYTGFELNTPLRYISQCFYGWKGTIRHRYYANHTTTANKMDVYVNKTIEVPYKTYQPLTGDANLAIRNDYMAWKKYSGRGEVMYHALHGESIIVDIPNQYASLFQEVPEVVNTEISESVQLCTAVTYYLSTLAFSPNVECYLSIGEDFNLVGMNPPPIVYVATL